MRIYLQLLKIQLKRAIRGIPKQLCGAIVLLGFISTIAFCSVKFMSKGSQLSMIPIGLVVEADSDIVEWAIDFTSEMDSMKGTMAFKRMELAQAYEELNSGVISAIMILPSNMVESILNGTNIPAQVILKDSNTLSSLLLKEMAHAGAKILSSAQADIYTVTDLYIAAGFKDKLQETYQQINIRNLRYALSREQLFQKESLLVTGNYSVMVYYCSTGILLFLLLFGINCSHLLRKDTRAFVTYLKIHKCSVIQRATIKWFSVFFLLIGVTLLFGGIFQWMAKTLAWEIQLTSGGLLCGVAVLACIASFILFCYSCTQTIGGGIILNFVASLLGLFVSGAFIPLGFFPSVLRMISQYLPTTYLFQAVLSILARGEATIYILPLFWSSVIFITIAIVVENHTERRMVNGDE